MELCCVPLCQQLYTSGALQCWFYRSLDAHLNCWSNITSQQKQGSKMKKVKAFMQVFSIVDPHPKLCMEIDTKPQQ